MIEAMVVGCASSAREYLNAILNGARHHDLPDDHISEIESVAH